MDRFVDKWIVPFAEMAVFCGVFGSLIFGFFAFVYYVLTFLGNP